MLIERHTIRNLDRDLLIEARIHAIQTGETLGAVINRAVEYYLYDLEAEPDEDAEIEEAA